MKRNRPKLLRRRLKKKKRKNTKTFFLPRSPPYRNNKMSSNSEVVFWHHQLINVRSGESIKCYGIPDEETRDQIIAYLKVRTDVEFFLYAPNFHHPSFVLNYSEPDKMVATLRAFSVVENVKIHATSIILSEESFFLRYTCFLLLFL